jgi:hypothetical protein
LPISCVPQAYLGHPVWIEHDGQKTGPLVLHERSKGQMGQELRDLT